MPIDVEFGVLIRISQIPDRVRKPRIRSPKGFLEEPIQNQDLEWHLEWYLGWYLEFDHFCREPGISTIRGQRPKIPMWNFGTIRGATIRGP